ncbi:MAG: 50S ribosomal protein L6 [candidate division WOR-3 bacterium]
MSRIGKKPIPVPKGVEVKIEEESCLIKGPLGELMVPLRPEVDVRFEEGAILVEQKGNSKFAHSIRGTLRQIIANAVEGVSKGFKRELLVVGSGYRAKVEEGKLILTVGYSHPAVFEPPEGIKVEVSGEKVSVGGTDAIRVTVSGPDKHKVGQAAAHIRDIKPPNIYKGKGIRYADEVIHLKPGKSATTGGK